MCGDGNRKNLFLTTGEMAYDKRRKSRKIN